MSFVDEVSALETRGLCGDSLEGAVVKGVIYVSGVPYSTVRMWSRV